MASNNAVGTGALILTANADKMLAGMDAAGQSASKKAANISRSVGKAADGGKGGGILSSLLGGAAGGLVGGAVFALAGEGLRNVLKVFDELDKRATGFDRGALAGIRQSFQGLQNAGLGILQKFVSAAAPAIMVLADSLLSLFEKLNPLIQGCADVFEVFAFTGAELISELIDSLGDLGINTEDWGQIALDVLRGVAKGFAYVWDTVKAGAGVMAVVAGLVVEGIGIIVKMIGSAITKLNDLAQRLPENLRPDWLKGVADTVSGWGENIDGIGQRMRGWGVDAIAGFGDSAAAVDGFFDRVGQRLRDTKDKIADLGGAIELKLSGAALKGGTEAYKIIASASTQNMVDGQNLAKQQLREQQKGNGLLKDIKGAVGKGGHGLGRI